MTTWVVRIGAALAATLACGLGHAAAQGLLAPAMTSYENADFDGALAALDDAATHADDTTDRVAIDHYRVLCLLALGRTADAQAATTRVFRLHPGYTLEDDSAPRVRALYDEVRARVLPELIRERYAEAKAHFDARRFLEAGTGFAVVADLGHAARTTGIGGPWLDDLLQLSAGFDQLAGMMAQPPAGTAGGDRPSAAAPRPADTPPSTAPSDDDKASTYYELGTAGVVPPIAINQSVSAWHRNVPRPRAGAPLGTIEVLVDETGVVLAARVLSSVSAFYDAVLLESAKTWRFRPAVKDGRPVRFRRVAAIVAGG